MCSSKSILIFCLFISVTIAKNITRESIGFPEQEEDLSSKNKDNRQPVYIPAMCPVNELFYPGDQKDDWICDCRPAYIYHPKSNKCWPAYRKGPCEDGNYLILTKESAIPVCEPNPCRNDTYVMYNGNCQRLATFPPCRALWPIRAVLTVNATNLAITCESLSFESRFGEQVPVQLQTTTPCPPGCKRNINGKCTLASS